MDLSKYKKVPDREVKFESIENTSSEIYYFDSEGKITDKDHATKVIIRQFDEAGNLINEIFGQCTPIQETMQNPKKTK